MLKTILCFMPGSVGGAQRMMITLVKFLDPKKFKVKIVIVQNKRGNIVDFIPSNFEVIHLKIKNIWDFPITRMVRLIKKEKADYLFSSIFYLNLRVLIASKILNVPVVLRNDNYTIVLNTLEKWLVRHIYKWANVVIMQQEEMLNEFKKSIKFPVDKLVVIHNPIDQETIDKKANVPSPYPIGDYINYVWVARFHPTKGQDILAKAFVLLHHHEKNAHLYFVGRYHDQIEYFNKVKKIIDDAGLTENVHYIGFDNNPYKWVKHCDCFVLPSRLEGLPNALVEAMYLKRPVVSTTCIDIIKDLIKDGHNGFWVAPEDYEAMSVAMRKAIRLEKMEMLYKPGQPEEFIRLFK